jgi:translation initiation factor IF-1
MAKEELIEMQGIVNEILPDLRCRVTLENGHQLARQDLATTCRRA